MLRRTGYLLVNPRIVALWDYSLPSLAQEKKSVKLINALRSLGGCPALRVPGAKLPKKLGKFFLIFWNWH